MKPYIALPRAPVVSGRQRIIVQRCEGKHVLHLGCADAGLLHERFQQGELMHQKLVAVASELWGVDTDAQSIAFLEDHGFNNLIVGDICELDRIEELRGEDFDVIVASEVIEHLDNPGLFLNAVKSLMIPGKTELIVTVPNAFRIDTLVWLLRGIEYVHPDHNYWFSYYTITNLLKKKGFDAKEAYVYSFQPTSILPNRLRRRFMRGQDADQPLVGEGGQAGVSSESVAEQALAYLRSLPRRVLVSLLYRHTPFWADGIVIVAIAK